MNGCFEQPVLTNDTRNSKTANIVFYCLVCFLLLKVVWDAILLKTFMQF